MINKQEVRERAEALIKKSATVTNLDDFLITHVPFKELKYCPSGIDSKITKSFSEEELFEGFIQENRNKHNLIVVQGNNGSGKSHFIRWLKYKYDNDLNDDSEISILIERNYNTLQGTIEQLLNNEVIQRYVNREYLNKLNEAGNSISTDKFLTMMNFTFVTEIMREDDDECILKSTQRKKLCSFLSHETVIDFLMLSENGPIKRIARKINNNSQENLIEDDIRFKEEDFSFSISGDFMQRLKKADPERRVMSCANDFIEDNRGFRKKVADYLNSKLDDVIQSTIKLNSQDLNNMLFNIRSELLKNGKNLTLFIEDITSFTGVDKAIIENLIIENSEENKICRLFSVVGITEAYYRDNFPDNLKDRVTGRIVIDKESILKDDNAILDVAARYINAIYLDKNQIKNWIKNGSSDSELPLSEVYRKWATYMDSDQRIFNIYPFTKEAFINLYNQLSIKTPRMVISNIILPIFMKLCDEKNAFPQKVEVLEAAIKLPEFKDDFIELKINKELSEEAERFKSLIRIWGDTSIDNKVVNGIKYLSNIPEEIYKEFNIPMINGNIIESKKEVKIEKVNITNIVTNNNSEKRKIENVEYKNVVEDLKQWYLKKSTLNNHSRLRDYILAFLKEAIYWEMEDVSPLLIAEALVKKNIFIEDQNTKLIDNNSMFKFYRNEENYFLLMALVDYNLIGNKKWNFEGASDRIVLINSWLSKNRDNIIKGVKENNGDNGDGYTIALLNAYYLDKLTNNDEINKDDIYRNLIKNNININSDKAIKILNDDIKILQKYEEEIKENNELVKRYYNCKLGDSDINRTTTFYLDSIKIIKCIEVLEENSWNMSVNKNKELSGIMNTAYELNLKLFSSTIINIINNKVLLAIDNINKIRKIMGYDEEFKSSIIEIKEFYNIAKRYNTFFIHEYYTAFEKYYLNDDKLNDKLRCIESYSSKKLVEKINLLEKNTLSDTNVYLETIKKVSDSIDDIGKQKQSITNNNDNLGRILDIKVEVNKCIDNLLRELSEVNGGTSSEN